jgi:hypothetical protein
MVYAEVNGVETPITLLQAYTESATDGEKGASRKDIVNLHNKGLTPVATVSSKRFQLGPKGNIVNTVTQDGQRFFSPISALGANVEFAVVGKLGFKYNGSDPNVAAYLENKPTAGFVNGQVVTVVTDPNGEKQILALSTKDMTVAGATAATKAIIDNNPNKFTAIVGVSSDTETDESTNFEDPNLLIVDILPTGEAFFKFYDTTNKSLIKVDLDNLRKALLGEPYRFSFVTPSFEDGNVVYQSVVRPEADYATVDVKDIFEKAIESKKYQVDVNQPLNQPYTSPINGKTYPTYIEYLSSNENFTGEPVTQGTSAILRTDSFADPFFDIGLKFEDLGVEEKVDVKTKEEVATNNVVIPTAPTTPVSTDAKVDVKKDRYYYNPVNRMVKLQKDSDNTPITKEEEEEIEAVIEKAKELGWDKDRLFRQLNSMGYSYAFGVHPEAYRNYLEDRLSGKTNIKVTSEFNFFEQLDKELAASERTAQPVSQPAGPRILPKSLVVTDPEILKQLSEEVDMINEIPTEEMPTSFEDFEQEVSGGATDLNDLMNTLVPDPNVTPTPATSTYVNAGKGENSIETKTTSSKFARGNRGDNTVDPNQANTEGSNTKC